MWSDAPARRLDDPVNVSTTTRRSTQRRARSGHVSSRPVCPRAGWTTTTTTTTAGVTRSDQKTIVDDDHTAPTGAAAAVAPRDDDIARSCMARSSVAEMAPGSCRDRYVDESINRSIVQHASLSSTQPGRRVLKPFGRHNSCGVPRFEKQYSSGGSLLDIEEALRTN